MRWYHITVPEDRPEHRPRSVARRWSGLFAAGGLAGALIASSCCIVPLVLVTLGISGVWVGMLTVIEPYKLYFVLVAVGLVGAGLWHVYARSMPPCEPGSSCDNPASRRATKIVLWVATAIIVQAATIDLWAPLLY